MSLFNAKKSLFYLLFTTCLVLPILKQNTLAHNVEISNEVAATFHIEPNHNPRVGQETQAWFALTRRGGQTIPLSACNCQLKVYTLPRVAEAKAVLTPSLQAINVEKYQEIPGAKITFPQPGAYELEVSGTAKDGTAFKPFNLSYTVNVRP